MNLTEYFDVFLRDYKDSDDSRIRVLVSPQQKIVYAYARKNGFITYKDIMTLYGETNSPVRLINQFVLLGILKESEDEEGKFYYNKEDKHNYVFDHIKYEPKEPEGQV